MATSPDGCFLVANYWPPGNCQGRFQQNVLTACTGAEALRRAEEQRQAEAQKQRDAPLFLVKTRVREWTPALERKFEFDFEQNWQRVNLHDGRFLLCFTLVDCSAPMSMACVP